MSKHHAMESCRKGGANVRTFLTVTAVGMSGQLHAPATLPKGKELPVPIGQEARWASEPVWT